MAKLTLQKVDESIATHIRKEGAGRVSIIGNNYLLAGYILDKAGIIDHLLTMYANKIHEKTSLLDMLEKSVSVGRIIEGDTQEPTSQKSKDPEMIQEPRQALKFGSD